LIDQLFLLVNKAAQTAGLAWPVIFANQNVPRLVKPYIQINVTTITIPDHLIYSPIDQDGNGVVSGWRKAVVEIQIYAGIESLSYASNIALVLQTESLLEYQQQIDVAVGQRLFLSYMPELLNESQFEGRAIYQFEMFYTENMNDNRGIIEGVDLCGAYVQTNSDTDPLKVFETCENDIAVICEESISATDKTIWDDDETNWDKPPKDEWDRILTTNVDGGLSG